MNNIVSMRRNPFFLRSFFLYPSNEGYALGHKSQSLLFEVFFPIRISSRSKRNAVAIPSF